METFHFSISLPHSAFAVCLNICHRFLLSIHNNFWQIIEAGITVFFYKHQAYKHT